MDPDSAICCASEMPWCSGSEIAAQNPDLVIVLVTDSSPPSRCCEGEYPDPGSDLGSIGIPAEVPYGNFTRPSKLSNRSGLPGVRSLLQCCVHP